MCWNNFNRSVEKLGIINWILSIAMCMFIISINVDYLSLHREIKRCSIYNCVLLCSVMNTKIKYKSLLKSRCMSKK